MINTFKNWKKQGKQFIPDIRKPVLPDAFKGGLPEISQNIVSQELIDLALDVCPTEALTSNTGRLSLDMGKCVFCGECERILGREKLKFTNQYKNATNRRERLIIQEGNTQGVYLDEDLVRAEIRRTFRRSLRLRQVSAGGDGGSELELNACGNVNFDMARFGIEFTASPRHSDGVVVTGAISENMSEALQICYDAVPNPKVLILCGTDAISGGIFAGSPALQRSFLEKYPIDLYVPGNPIHPLAFINGVLEMIKYKF